MTRKTGPSSFAYFHLQHFPNFTKPRVSIFPLDKIRDDIPKYPGAALMGESFAEGPASRGVFVILKDVNMVFGSATLHDLHGQQKGQNAALLQLNSAPAERFL